MKTVFKFLTVAVFTFLATTTHAQLRDSIANNNTSATISVQQQWQNEYVFMKDGEMMLHLNGKDLVLGGTYPCADSTRVSTKGAVTKKDGTTVQLKDGDKVFADGKIEAKNSQ